MFRLVSILRAPKTHEDSRIESSCNGNGITIVMTTMAMLVVAIVMMMVPAAQCVFRIYMSSAKRCKLRFQRKALQIANAQRTIHTT